MHKQIIWINRLLNPNKNSYIARNKTYLSYICNKENVFRNEHTTHGLFGEIKDIPNIDKNNDITAVQEYINRLSKEKKNIYRGIISFNEADAIEKGFDEKQAWEDLVRTKLPEFAKSINIPENRLEFVASIHLDKGHPHIHIMFWDREQEIQRNFIHKSISNKFRVSLNKYVFADEYISALKERDIIKSDFISEEKNIEKYLINEMTNSKDFEIDNEDSKYNYLGTMYRDRIPQEELDDLTEQLLELKVMLPKTGSIDYKYLLNNKEVKDKVDSISYKLIDISPGLKNEFNKYIQKTLDIAKITTTNDPKQLKEIKKLAEKDLIKQIGNKVLNVERQILQKDRLEEWEKIQLQNNMIFGISELISVFSQLNQSYDNHYNSHIQNRDLTREERIELAKKMKDKGSIEW